MLANLTKSHFLPRDRSSISFLAILDLGNASSAVKRLEHFFIRIIIIFLDETEMTEYSFPLPGTTTKTPAQARSSQGLRGRRTTTARNNGPYHESDSQASNSSLQGISIGNGKSKLVTGRSLTNLIRKSRVSIYKKRHTRVYGISQTSDSRLYFPEFTKIVKNNSQVYG